MNEKKEKPIEIDADKKLAKNIEIQLVDIFSEIYQRLTPATWIVNLQNGETRTSKNFESFLDLSEADRNQITAMRLQLGKDTYTISRKIDGKLLPGFFFHIKAGRKPIFGKIKSIIPFCEERFGFCYNNKGDSFTVEIDHSGFLKEVTKIKNEVLDLLGKPLTNEIKINKTLQKNITYNVNYEIYPENLIKKRVNVNLFGKLDSLPAETEKKPKISDHAGEITIKAN